MIDPVMAADGFTYDRANITDWIESNCTSPKTGEAISSHVFPNHEKKVQIDQWRAEQSKEVVMGDSDMESLLSRVAWAESSDEACAHLTNLSSIITQNHSLVPAQQMHRMRHHLNADETIWCPQVASLLDGLDTQCRTLARTLNTNLKMSRRAAKRAAATAEGMVTNLAQQQRMLKAAEERVKMLKSQVRISEEGPKKMRQVEAGYSAKAEAMEQDLSGYSSESIAEAESQNIMEETRKRPRQCESDAFLPAKRCKKDTEALLEGAMSMDHDLAKERVHEAIVEPCTPPQIESFYEPSTPQKSLCKPRTPPFTQPNAPTTGRTFKWKAMSRAADFASRLSSLLTPARESTRPSLQGGRLVLST